MPRIQPNSPAPDFEAEDLEGNPVSLSSLRAGGIVILVFNRGFI